MARKRENQLVREYHDFRNYTTAATAGHFKNAAVLHDISTILGTIAGQGEEARIAKATVTLGGTHSSAGVIHLAVLVADDAIASNPAGGVSAAGNLDDDMDVLTAGDYESKVVGHIPIRTIDKNVGPQSFDITSLVQKAATMSSKSALLDANPNCSVIAVIVSTAPAAIPAVWSDLRLDYRVVAKPLRMLA